MLKPGGQILLKTDSRDLYLFTLEELEDARFRVLEKSEDLHRSPYAEENIVGPDTKRNSSQAGHPIYYLFRNLFLLEEAPVGRELEKLAGGAAEHLRLAHPTK